MHFKSFVKYCLTNGARIMPLTIPSNETNHLGICNPSILIEDNQIKFILRNVNYALWSNDNQYRLNSPYGPLYYVTPDKDPHLRTQNFLCKLNETGVLEYNLIDTSKNDWDPQWEFVGHEDMRLVRWNGKLYGTGVQRDWNTTGIGRMHLSELDETTGKEISRVRIEAPDNPNSYCEKNWMPILDMPYHYIKWCYPTEVVKINPETGESEFVFRGEEDESIEFINTNNMGIRGSSQVVRWGNYRIALVHMCELWINEKQQKSGAGYLEQFIVWDEDWNIIKLSKPFSFCDYCIEFTNGLAFDNGTFYLPFALQDNTTYMLMFDEDLMSKFIFDQNYDYGDYMLVNNDYLEYFNNTTDSNLNVNMANKYFNDGHYASAMVFYIRACEYNTFNSIDELYGALYMAGLSVARLGERDILEHSLWCKLIDIDPNRSEAYLMLSRYYSWRRNWCEAYTFSRLAITKNNYKFINENSDIVSQKDGYIDYLWCKYYTENYESVESEINNYISTNNLSTKELHKAEALVNRINENKQHKQRIL